MLIINATEGMEGAAREPIARFLRPSITSFPRYFRQQNTKACVANVRYDYSIMTMIERRFFSMKKIAAGTFKVHCLAVMDEVQAKREAVLITKRGKPVAKLVPAAEDRGQW
jgi:prevent-host-death family protein